MKSTTCAFTGHRPSRFAFGYDEKHEQHMHLKQVLSAQIERLIIGGVTTFYTGMALGVDQWAVLITLDMKKMHPNTRLIAVLPCETQANHWSVNQRERYYNILSQCDDVITLQHNYTSACMFERNRYLIEHAKHLLAVFDGGVKRGTAYTVKYARKLNREITIIHPDTLWVSGV